MKILPNPSPVKSVQRGILNSTDNAVNATIASVDMNKSVLNFSVATSTVSSTYQSARSLVRGALDSPMNINFYRYNRGDIAYISWELIEYV